MTGLRIGLVCPYSFEAPGGVQNHVLGLAGWLREHGYRPSVLAPGPVENGPDGVRLTSAGAAVPVRYNGSVARVNFGPLSAARVRRWLQQGRFDLVHIHEPITPSISLLALWAAETPVVATYHTATPRSRSMQLAGGVLRAAVEKIDAGIAVSDAARRVVVQHLGRDPVVVPNGLRLADFTAAAAVPRPPGRPPRLVFLGRIDEPRKGLPVLLAALPAIRAAAGDVEVVIAGQGSAVLPADCTVLGAVDDATRARLLASADVFVAPHLARESFGIVLLEAMASGAPVVASDLPAFADVLSGGPDGRVGALFPAGDPAALAEAVLATLRRPDPARVAAARARAEQYDWSRVGAQVSEVYEATLAAARRPSPLLRGVAGAGRRV